MTDQDKLLPCPFCGSSDLNEFVHYSGSKSRSVIQCLNCDCEMTKKKWNFRTVLPQRADLCTTPPDADARIARLEEALRWYASREAYQVPGNRHAIHPRIMKDKGQRARAALENK